MPSREYYQRQAETLRNMARASNDPVLSARYIKHATEYQVLADAIPPDEQTEKRPVRQQEQQHERRAASRPERK